ncbi:coiled-coil domain-containing protein 114 [Latimeria chalumnae]|uniref:Outer dynein arm docking complex subunit 1 n=1 Tax=Latimeria chalumnae TaxID=7897 RepID=H2ZWF3_LATCH|nr:PREDICTED: coiled-coil domain-containing protein 114-like [Latimeria chalumnae]XP_014342831.1 PREDICTED: coiled-coil domain-containing protein 114-like [Latimeria chalumnae]XP_014342832.1 PREDICTED: coiled-coil domain-containing protein 114-like [Latimeria chalumnae]|eukprot:XP_005994268.1 PREDICTED: coiled-coil domain-containing protein 114-like [Latimeria chalumnae]
MPRGRSAASNISNNSDVDTEGLAESELGKLQRQYRIMEGDRQAYGSESQEIIRRQLAEIQQLQKEHEELLKNIRISERKVIQVMDQDNTEDLRQKLEYKDTVEEQMAKEKEIIAELDQEIKNWERKVFEQRKQVGGLWAKKKYRLQIQRSIKTLENRLDLCQTRFNIQLVRNSRLRGKINTLRIEKSRFEQLYKKLEKELRETQKRINEIMDISSAAYEARDEAQTKMLSLKDKAEKDLLQHVAEIRELQRILNHDKKVKEFMVIKAQERNTEEELLLLRQRKEKEEADRKKKEPQEDTLEVYEEAFQKIKAVSGQEDLHLLVKSFIEVEDQNFAVFNYINEQNNQIESLKDEIEEIQGMIDTFKAQDTQLENEHTAILKGIELKQEEARNVTSVHNGYLEKYRQIMDQLKIGAESLFSKLKSERCLLDDMLGASMGVRDDNIMKYLGLFEQRTTELLAIYSYLNFKVDNKTYNPQEVAMHLLGQNSEISTQDLQVLLPSTSEDYESEIESPITDEEERPLTQSELRERIMRGVIKREKKSGKRHSTEESSSVKETKDSKISTSSGRKQL